MKHVKNEMGSAMLMALMAGLVIFTAFALVKVSTMGSLQPDLRRIGLNIGPDATTSPLANNQTTSPTQTADDSTNNALSVAGDSLDADLDIDSEGDTPFYIE